MYRLSTQLNYTFFNVKFCVNKINIIKNWVTFQSSISIKNTCLIIALSYKKSQYYKQSAFKMKVRTLIISLMFLALGSSFTFKDFYKGCINSSRMDLCKSYQLRGSLVIFVTF